MTTTNPAVTIALRFVMALLDPLGYTMSHPGCEWSNGDLNCDTAVDTEDIPLFVDCVLNGNCDHCGVVIETVTVGNPGNPGEGSGESEPAGWGPDRICGAVAYTYNIGKYEVTAGQYTEFLNAVAATDTYGLYNSMMDSLSNGCQITQNGTSGSYTYDFSGRPSGTEADWVNRPVNFVSWADAARFANWLHNGQLTGAQDATTTEDGAYDLSATQSYYGPNGETPAYGTDDWDSLNDALIAVIREPAASVFLPSEDEWYKAAYHKNDGVTGNYWDYPTSSNGVPSNDLDGSGNNATFFDGDLTIGSPYYRTEFGAHVNSESPYDTFDQGGNLWEWDEAILYGSFRGLRGGSFSYGGNYLHAAFRGSYGFSLGYPSNEDRGVGFRVAEVD